MKRVNTGIIRFGDDWPGLFVRGDVAINYALSVQAFLEKKPRLPDRWALEGLRDKLQATKVTPEQEPPMVILTAEMEREAIVTWLRGMACRCPHIGMPERKSWYEGVADNIEWGNITMNLKSELKS
jgi:hypothetical protein